MNKYIAATSIFFIVAMIYPIKINAEATQTQCSERHVSATYNYNFCRRNSAVPNGQPGAYSCESFSRTQRFDCFEAYNACVYERYLRQTSCQVNATNTGCVLGDTYGGTPPCASGATLSPTNRPPTLTPSPTPVIPPPPTILPTPTSTPPVTVNNPTGNTDLASCSVIAGWSCDRDNPDAQIQVAIFNGPYNPSDTSNFLGYFPANAGGGNGADAEAIAAACGSTNPNIGHRFVVTFPQEWINGQVYNIHVYAINIGGGQNVLVGSPISVDTAPCLATTAPTSTPSPSPTPAGTCQLVRAYRPTGDLGIASNWGTPLTAAQLATLRAGDTVYFTVVGNVTGGNVTAGRIRVNASTWSTRDVTTSFKPNAAGVDSSIREYYRAYVVPANTYSFTVGAEIYSPVLDTNNDMNDGNLGWR